MDRAQAEGRRDLGIERSRRGADAASPNWGRAALVFVRRYATLNSRFLTEDLREWAHANGYPRPPSAKAWGSVMLMAAREKIIVADGYAPANSSNRSPKVRWKSLLCAEQP